VERVKSKDGKTMQPLCMAQHYQMFQLYRRPGHTVDERIHLNRTSSGDHIIVAHYNQVNYFKLYVYFLNFIMSILYK
jgi:choline O-acetyltransferase